MSSTAVVRTTTIAAAVLLAACSPSASTATTTTPPAATSSPVTSTPTTTAAPEESVCLSGDLTFRGNGIVATLGSGSGDAEQLSGIRWAAHPGCERVVIDLLTMDGAPAGSLGEAAVEMMASRGIIRISLPPEVTTTGLADTLIDGGLATRAYVVRLPDRSLAVDLHLATSVPVEVRGFTVASPTRIVVDLRSAAAGGRAVAAPPAVGENIVVLSPTALDDSYPITVSGYARAFEAAVVARLLVDGEVAAETVATANDWLDAWGSFSMTIATGPKGQLTVFVGEDSPADGSPSGVTIPLVLP